MRVAIVHERFTDYAGSERVVEELAREFPDADVLAPIVDPSALPPTLDPSRVRDSGLRRFYGGGERYAHLLPLLPAAMARLPLAPYDLVLTSHHAFANRVRPRPGVPVVSYTHSPARWVWEPSMLEGEAGGRAGQALLRAFGATQRRPDTAAAQRLRAVVANSTEVADRVRRWWGREAAVVHPPVALDVFTADSGVPREDFLLVAGRLVPYKRPEVAVAAAVRAGLRVVVVGEGRARPAVEAAARGGRVELLGRVDDAQLRDLFRRCRALVMPGVEDFGIVPVEAQACGAPVVGVAAGGLLDIVVPGVTGALVEPGPGLVERLAEVLARLPEPDPAACAQNAQRFSAAAFRAGFRAQVEAVL